MKSELYRYDIFPKVILTGVEKEITIQPLGAHAAFIAENEYVLRVYKVDQSNPHAYPERGGRFEFKVKPDCDGCLRFSHAFEGEGEYLVNIHANPAERHFCTLALYALEHDMAGRIPYRGDLHMHTRRSDGQEAPATVAANYRGHGYDFTVISDHHRYYPSLEARAFWGELTDLAIVQGEEVHLPFNDVHYVNFGGSYSINALVKPSVNDEQGDDLAHRSLDGKAPEPMTRQEFEVMIRERAKHVERENESERLSFAVLEWIYEHMQKNGGLGIFPHPYWLCQMMHLPEDYTKFIYEKAPFDAFEVLGGENYYQHNGFQVGLYYEMKAKGIDHPVVGSTDSHGSTEHNRNALICSTIVFAKENSTEGLVKAIKEKYSIAVDTISAEYRLVGDFRLMKYASFLMENYFPLHDLACRTEGYYMNRYIAGDSRAEVILKEMKGQIPEMQKKYFAV